MSKELRRVLSLTRTLLLVAAVAACSDDNNDGTGPVTVDPPEQRERGLDVDYVDSRDVEPGVWCGQL